MDIVKQVLHMFRLQVPCSRKIVMFLVGEETGAVTNTRNTKFERGKPQGEPLPQGKPTYPAHLVLQAECVQMDLSGHKMYYL